MELVLDKKESALGGTLLVAGCCMGAGMLGLPVVSAMSGFIPSTLAMIVCYFFATSTGLLLLEASLWFDHKVSLFSIANLAFGKSGQIVASLLFLFLYYCLFVAYIDGGGQLFASALGATLNLDMGRETGVVICTVVIGLLSYAGTKVADLANRYLMCGLLATFFLLVVMGASKMNVDNLLYSDWTATLSVMPIMLVCFGFQNIVPSLTFYMKRHVTNIRFAILIGNLIPFVIYLTWNFVILGLVSPLSLAAMTNQTEMVAGMLKESSNYQLMLVFMNVFSFFAIFTSVLPNAVSFVDFLGDSFKTLTGFKRTKHLLILGVFLLPPAIFSFFTPHLFLKALGLAGGLADVLLLGILPVGAVWIGRYAKKMNGPYTVTGGKPFLMVVFLLSLFFLIVRN